MTDYGPKSWSMQALQDQVRLSRTAQQRYQYYNQRNDAMILADYNNIVGGKYKLIRTIGSGTFGVVFLAEDLNRPGYPVAVKVESVNHKHPLIPHETFIYQHLLSRRSEHYYQGRAGIPYHYWTGTQSDYNILVMEKLGDSLETLFNKCNRTFTLKTTLMLADQMISLLEYIHAKDIIHRDIKPDNFLMGGDALRNPFRVYIIDFGISKFYRSRNYPYLHLPMRTTGSVMANFFLISSDTIPRTPRISSGLETNLFGLKMMM